MELLASREQALGATHPNTLSTKSGLVATLLNRGDSVEAGDLAREVFEVQQTSLGDRHPATLRAKALLSVALPGGIATRAPTTSHILSNGPQIRSAFCDQNAP